METTTVRVRKTTQKKLRQLSVASDLRIADVIDRLVTEQKKSFWEGFEDEAKSFLDKGERRLRKSYEGALSDGLRK